MADLSAYTKDIPEAKAPIGDIDYAAIARDLAADAIELLKRWYPAGIKSGKNFLIGNLMGDKGKSLSIDLATGKWIDHATGECGGDLISLYAQMHGLTNFEAALELGGTNPPTKAPLSGSIKPVIPDRVELPKVWNAAPPWAASPPCIHYKHGKPTSIWIYKNEEGKVIGAVARYDPAGERKQFVPWTCTGSNWEPKGWAGVRPIYGLHELTTTNPQNVLIVEGEKACDAARRIVGSDWFVVSWPGGAQAINRVDWSALQGKNLLLWPDADEAGVSAMREISVLLKDKCPHVAILDVRQFPAKWDAADALADGWDQQRFDALLAEQFAPATGEAQDAPAAESPKPKPKAPKSDLHKEEHRPVPPHLLQIPGVLQEGVAWMLATSMRPQPIYAVQAMLGLGSTVLGRVWTTTYANWSPLYYCVIGGSGTGKESIKTCIEDILTAAGLANLIGPSGYSSAAGLLSSMIHQPNHIHITDEFGKVIEASAEKGNTLKREVMRLMIELWGRCNGTQRAVGMSTTGMSAAQMAALQARFVVKPSLIQMAMTTKDQFFDALTTDSLMDGHLNRYLTVQCHTQRVKGTFRAKIDPPTSLTDWCAAQRVPVVVGNLTTSTADAHDAEPVSKLIDFDDDAKRMIEEYDQACVDRANGMDVFGLGEMWSRANEMAMRLSMVIARSCGSDVIRRDHLSWAQDYVTFHNEEFVESLRVGVSDSSFAGAMQDVQKLLQKSGDEGMTEKRIRDFSRKFRALPPRGQVDVIEMLRRNGLIESVTTKSFSGRGKPKTVWVWCGNHPGSEDE